jgi:LytS/YehU family sensor histidine kinase
LKTAFKTSIFFSLASGFAVYSGAILIHYLIITVHKRKEAEMLAYKNSLLKTKAELKFLKSAIHPHFLFNSLNLLTPIINKDPQLAKTALSHLSEFLLYSLRFSSKEQVTIQDEIDHIKDYLSIESLRLQERLDIQYQINEDVLDYKIVPLTLLPLVENAIKHGIEQLIEGGQILIRIENLSNNRFIIEVQNPYKSYNSLKGSNMGLYILKERLKDFFGSDILLSIDKKNEKFNIRLTIPIKG